MYACYASKLKLKLKLKLTHLPVHCTSTSLDIILLDQTEIRDLGRNITRMIAWVGFIGFFFGNSREQKDGTFKVTRATAIGHDNVGMVVGPIGRRRNGFLVGQLQRLDTTHNLVHVSTKKRESVLESCQCKALKGH